MLMSALQPLGALEPELAGRFAEGLHLPGEAWLNPLEAMEFIKTRILSTRNNEEFLMSMNG